MKEKITKIYIIRGKPEIWRTKQMRERSGMKVVSLFASDFLGMS